MLEPHSQLVLCENAEIVFRDDWPEFMRRSGIAESWVAAINAPSSRVTSRVVDRPTAELVALFDEPRSVVDAVIAFCHRNAAEPEATLSAAAPLLDDLLRAGVLVVAHEESSPTNAARNTQSLAIRPGDDFHGWSVQSVVHSLTDTCVCKASRAGDQAALKIIAREGPQWVLRALHNEIEMLSTLDVPAVPRLLDADLDGDPSWMATTWRDGTISSTLAAELRLRPQAEQRVGLLDLLVSVAESLASLHDVGLIHGDIQPKNILVSRHSFKTTIVDLGFSRRASAGAATGAATLPPVGGVPRYFAPEQLPLTAQDVLAAPTQASEQYALAALFYEWVSSHPYLDAPLDRAGYYAAVRGQRPRALSSVGVRGWEDLDEVLQRALAKNPFERFGSISEFAAALQECRNRAPLPTPARPLVRSTLETVTPFASVANELRAPRASVNYGAAGIAIWLYRKAQIVGDGVTLAAAHSWAKVASRFSRLDDGFYNPALGITRETVGTASLYHSALGVHVVDALVAHAIGEDAAPSVDAALSTATGGEGDPLDLVSGVAGRLLACAHLLDTAAAAGLGVEVVSRGDDLVAEIWRRQWTLDDVVPGCAEKFVGVAHGWGGVVYATLVWARLRGLELPEAAARMLEDIAAVGRRHRNGAASWPRVIGVDDAWPGWCHGSAGMAMLFAEAARTAATAYEELAVAAARHTLAHTGRNASLCCGSAGQAYACLAIYRLTGDRQWLAGAEKFARCAGLARSSELPASLYKGAVGTATLEADLRRPEYAVMPLFEPEGWSEDRRSRSVCI